MGRPVRAAPAPILPYRWRLTDFRLSQNSCEGEALTAEQAKADALHALGMIGRGMNGIGLQVCRPSGKGGWFARASDGRPCHFGWVPWEKGA